MNYEDYKQEWEEFFTTPMLFAYNSCAIDIARVSDDDSDDLAHELSQKLIRKFCNGISSGRYYKYYVLDDWANQYVRKDLFDRAKELIEKTRREDKKNG